MIDKVDCKLYHTIIARIKELNNAIHKDSTLGKGFEIGHSYFAPEDISVIDNEWVRNVVEYEIIPLIEEYWFDKCANRLRLCGKRYLIKKLCNREHRSTIKGSSN